MSTANNAVARSNQQIATRLNETSERIRQIRDGEVCVSFVVSRVGDSVSVKKVVSTDRKK